MTAVFQPNAYAKTEFDCGNSSLVLDGVSLSVSGYDKMNCIRISAGYECRNMSEAVLIGTDAFVEQGKQEVGQVLLTDTQGNDNYLDCTIKSI
jgi:hypothetical protein